MLTLPSAPLIPFTTPPTVLDLYRVTQGVTRNTRSLPVAGCSDAWRWSLEETLYQHHCGDCTEQCLVLHTFTGNVEMQINDGNLSPLHA